jgi:lipoprotein-releasing system permease protein
MAQPRALQVTVAIGLVLLLVWGSARFLKWAFKFGSDKVMLGAAVFCLLCALGFGTWVSQLPETRGGQFILWHQVVRGAALVFTVVFAFLLMLLSIPWGLSRVERSGPVGFVSARHMRASKSGFLTVISVLSILGVFLSSFALCSVISVMGGFGADLKRKILGNNAHISVDYDNVGGFADWDSALTQTRVLDGVVAATPMAQGEAMISSNSNTAGVNIRGVDLESVGTVIDLVKNIEVGDFRYLTDTDELADLPPDTVIGIGPGGHSYLQAPRIQAKTMDLAPDVKEVLRAPDAYPGLILGRELARSLHVLVGDELRLVAPLGDLGPMGVMPRTRHYRVAGIFYSGMYEYDASHVYMRLEQAQDFLDLQGKVTNIEVRVEDAEAATLVVGRVQNALKERGLRVRDWKELNKNLFSALKLEKIATFIILCLAITVACFCIICTLLLMVTEKSKEIAIIKSLGATDNMVLRIFMLEGLMIGGVGTLLGVVTGWVAAEGLQRFGVKLDPEVYYVDRLPIEVNPADYALVALCALVITVLATIGPARAAAQLRPVDGIRYE